MCLAGCQTSEGEGDSESAFAGGVFSDLQARNPKGHPDVTSTGTARPRAGSTQTFGPDPGLTPVGSGDRASSGQYTLNFDRTDIKDVARAILNDALHVNYSISGDLSGPVTISSARPVSREQLLSTLETSLSSFGFSLNRSGGGYTIAASGVSGGTVDFGSRTRAGFGVSIIPLSFVSAATMMQLVSGFVAEADGLRVNAAGNTIIVRGSGPQRAEVVEAVLSFDSDFMQHQSVSIFRLAQARPEQVVPELDRIFNSQGQGGAIQFRAVNRLRGIMAISRNSALLKRAESWVRRLDQQDGQSGNNVVVYKARYRKAAELATVMNNLFGGASGSSAAPSSRQAQSQPMGDPTRQGASGKDNPATSEAEGSGTAVLANNRVASAFATASDDTIGAAYGGIPNVVDLTSGAQETQSPMRISADPSNNSVVIYGDADRASEILQTLKRLDATPVQVAINVTIAEVRLSKDLKYGVQYFINSKHLGLGNNNGSVSLVDEASNVLKKQIPGLNFVIGTNADPDVIISALDVIGDVEVLSSPSLVVLENQTATLQVGDEVPITTRQSQSLENAVAPVVNQVEFKNTGIILNVTPRISQNDAVTMQIEQEISSVASGANTLTPTISKRRLASQISVNDQQTVLLGGLISASTDNGKSGVPGANKLPVFGGLFGQTKKSSTRTELIVLIRPVIIRDAQDAANVAESLRAQMSVIGARGGGRLK
ncbi:type II secretion system protein GspD [Rhizobium rhizosphaerae]|uniref:Type II secretion system protein GspD n=1 Tax=Xaviernesmea rhizosphaerae TaxID=1672749 RepID=A0A1Q9AIH4_9HYPH|nr:type II secretion system protein GspD [Xaviernesmea rhizosphaerae]